MADAWIKDCPLCGSSKIDINSLVLDVLPNKMKKIQAYCYCRNCGYKGPKAIGLYDDKEDKKQAINMWNKNKI